jgi:integrase
MPKLNFTVKSVEALKPKAERTDYWDTNLKGFVLRVTPDGTKTFSVMYYNKNNIRRRYTIGTFPPETLFGAREKAKEILRQKNLDPAVTKKQEREAERPKTFGELTIDYMEIHVKPNKAPRSQAEDQRQVDAYLRKWKKREASSITISDVDTLLEGIAKTGPVQANRTRSLLRHMFRWVLSKETRRRQFNLSVNPVADTEKPAKEKPRTRVHSDAELKALWKGFDQVGTVGDAFKVQLLTAARSGEVVSMKWSDLELSRAVWTQPETKNHKVHVVPLPPAAVRLLEGRKAKQAKSKNRGKKASPYVFHNPRNPDEPMKWLQKAAGRVRKHAVLDDGKKVNDFRPHDLRRTVATRLAEMGVPDAVLKMILNHSLGSDITGVYNQYKYFEERRQALEAWATKLEKIVRGLKEVGPEKVKKAVATRSE